MRMERVLEPSPSSLAGDSSNRLSFISGLPIGLAETSSGLHCKLKLFLFNSPSFPHFLHRCQTSLFLPLSFILRACLPISLCISNSVLASASGKIQNDTSSKAHLQSPHVLVFSHEKGFYWLLSDSPLPLHIFLK